LPAGLAGCYAGAAAIIFGASGDSGGGGAKRENDPPAIQLGLPERIGGVVRLPFILENDNDAVVEAFFGWKRAGSGDDEFTAINGDPERFETSRGQPHALSFEWDAAAALLSDPRVQRATAIVNVKVRLVEVEGKERESTWDAFWAGNEKPVIESLVVDGFPDRDAPPLAALSGLVALQARLADSSCDQVSLSGEFWIGDGSTRLPMTLKQNVGLLRETCDASGRPLNESAFLFWDTLEDFKKLGDGTSNQAFDDVRVEITPRDVQGEEGDPKALDYAESSSEFALAVDNNSDPVVQIVNFPGALDRSFVVPIRFLVQDEERQTLGALFQWTRQGEEFPDKDGAFLEELEPIVKLSGAARSAALIAYIAANRQSLRLLSEAEVSVWARVDLDPELPRNQVRVLDLARKGLGFLPPGKSGPRSVEDPAAAGDERFLVGKAIALFEIDGQEPFFETRIAGYRPADAVVELAAAPERELRAGTRCRIRINAEMQRLLSSKDGILHTFLWDSEKDLDSFLDRDATLRVRAVVFDTQPALSPPVSIELRSGGIDAALLENDEPARAMDFGDVDGDGLLDAAVLSGRSVRIYSHDPLTGELLAQPLQVITDNAFANANAFALGDVNGDGRNDLVVVLTLTREGRVYRNVACLAADCQPPVLPFDAGETLTLAAVANPAGIALGDVNGDGRNDVVITSDTERSADVFLQDPFGNLGLPIALDTRRGPHLRLETGVETRAVRIADATAADGYHRNDVIVVDKHGAGQTTLLRATVYPQGPNGILGQQVEVGGRLLYRGEPGPILSADARAAALDLDLADVDGDGTLDLVVANLDSGTLQVFLQLGSGRISLAPDEELPLHGAAAAEPIDFDGDGKVDIALLDRLANRIRIHLQAAPGADGRRFSDRRDHELATEVDPTGLEVVDLDGDGREDWLAAHQRSEKLALYRQGVRDLVSPAPAVTLTQDLNLPAAVAIGDVNGDGLSDIVVANKGDGAIRAYYQKDFTGFSLVPDRTMTLEPPPGSGLTDRILLAIADLSRDGLNDVIAAHDEAATVFVIRQEKNGGLPSAAVVLGLDLGLSDGLSALAVGDLNADGLNDLIAGHQTERQSTLFLQDALKSPELPFSPEDPELTMSFPADSQPVAICIADFDLDAGGRPDFLASTRSEVAIQVSSSIDGKGGRKIPIFEPEGCAGRRRTTGPNSAVAVVDANGDHRRDLVVVNGSSRDEGLRAPVFLSGASSTPAVSCLAGSTLQTGPSSSGAAVGDINGDGREDLVVVNADELRPSVRIYLRGASGALGPRPTQVLRTSKDPVAIAVGDLTGDGRDDIVVVNETDNNVEVFLAR
jgi:hypothetical protein